MTLVSGQQPPTTAFKSVLYVSKNTGIKQIKTILQITDRNTEPYSDQTWQALLQIQCQNRF